MSAIEKKKEDRVMRYNDWDAPVYRAVREYVSKRCYLSQDLKGVRAQRLVCILILLTSQGTVV